MCLESQEQLEISRFENGISIPSSISRKHNTKYSDEKTLDSNNTN
jgi:hypothetical protein